MQSTRPDRIHSPRLIALPASFVQCPSGRISKYLHGRVEPLQLVLRLEVSDRVIVKLVGMNPSHMASICLFDLVHVGMG